MEVRGRIKPGLTLMPTQAAADKIYEKYWIHKIVLNLLSDPEKKKNHYQSRSFMQEHASDLTTHFYKVKVTL